MSSIALKQCLRARAPLRLSGAAPLLRRSFATTDASTSGQEVKRHVAFDPDVSPQLAPLLAEIQEKIILPSYVNPKQRQRIFNPKYASSLKTNPVFIEIDDINHRFEPTPPKALPRTHKIVRKAIKAMETPRDFDNVIRLMTGLKHAGRLFDVAEKARIVRMLATKGQLYLLLEAARQVKRTGMQVGAPIILHTLLTWTQVKALDAGWERGETEQALKWSRNILEMASLPAHKVVPNKAAIWAPWPLERDPIALTAPLHLAAAIAVGHEGGRDVDGTVAFYARQLVNVWPQDKGFTEVYPAEAVNAHARHCSVNHVLHPATIYVPLIMALHGLKLASQVVEPKLAQHLDAIAVRLEADLAVMRSSRLETLKDESLLKSASERLFDTNGALKFEVKAAEPAAAAEEVVAEEK